MEDQGTAMQAIRFALDHCNSESGMVFLDDWRAGSIDAWPEYKEFLAQDGDADG